MNKISDFLTINGVKYRVAVLSIEREAPVLDRNSARVETGALEREVLGTFYNYKIKFAESFGAEDDYDRLYEVLTSPVPFHTVSLPYGRRGTHTYKAYISSVKDKVFRVGDNETLWNGLSASFIAMNPART